MLKRSQDKDLSGCSRASAASLAAFAVLPTCDSSQHGSGLCSQGQGWGASPCQPAAAGSVRGDTADCFSSSSRLPVPRDMQPGEMLLALGHFGSRVAEPQALGATQVCCLFAPKDWLDISVRGHQAPVGRQLMSPLCPSALGSVCLALALQVPLSAPEQRFAFCSLVTVPAMLALRAWGLGSICQQILEH